MLEMVKNTSKIVERSIGVRKFFCTLLTWLILEFNYADFDCFNSLQPQSTTHFIFICLLVFVFVLIHA